MYNKMKTRVITVRHKLDTVIFVFVACYLLCCGDIEMNPGPVTNTETTYEKNKHNNDATPPSTTDSLSSDVATKILETVQAMRADMNGMCSDIGSIKTDIGRVRDKCDDIDNRCRRLETENSKLAESVADMAEDVADVRQAASNNEYDIGDMQKKLEDMAESIASLKGEVDKQEGYSRRDNLRMFGIAESDGAETFDTCAQKVVDALNSVQERPKTWTTEDIERAHRVGTKKNGQPRTMIVKFGRWRDKMAVITNKAYRSKLEGNGLRVANDLTNNQASIVADAKREGMVAFFRKGKLVVEPRRSDPRTQRDNHIGSTRSGAGDHDGAAQRNSDPGDHLSQRAEDWPTLTPEHSDHQGLGNAGHPLRPDDDDHDGQNAGGGRRSSAGGDSRAGAQARRASSAGGKGGAGLGRFWAPKQQQQQQPPRQGDSRQAGQGGGRPRRSERNKQ